MGLIKLLRDHLPLNIPNITGPGSYNPLLSNLREIACVIEEEERISRQRRQRRKKGHLNQHKMTWNKYLCRARITIVDAPHSCCLRGKIIDIGIAVNSIFLSKTT